MFSIRVVLELSLLVDAVVGYNIVFSEWYVHVVTDFQVPQRVVATALVSATALEARSTSTLTTVFRRFPSVL